MSKQYQVTMKDLIISNQIDKLPGRTAYIDECGNGGFDFDKEGVSSFYILTAVIVENTVISQLHDDFAQIKKENGFQGAELKSSAIKDNRRVRIMNSLLPLPFRLIVLIVDKKQIRSESPLRKHRPSFIKFLDKQLYNVLYQAYPKLTIQQDEVGWPEFQDSFRKYVNDNRPEYNLLDQYDFDFVNSKDEVLVQLSDFIGGSLSKCINDTSSYNYLELLNGKINQVIYYPYKSEPYWGRTIPGDHKYDDVIFSLSIKTVHDFIERYQKEEDIYVQMQIAVLEYLKMYVMHIDSTKYIFADELIQHLLNVFGIAIKRNDLYRHIIAPIRDKSVLLASCNKGYKIPISSNDLVTYLNQSMTTVGPMIARMGVCRTLVKNGTDNSIDLFDDPAFTKLKRYFDEPT